jgi:hypothetical protein
MQSEDLAHIEKKVLEAAENHFPAYNDSAWPKMKALLDKHMPEKERKRRIILFMLLFLFLGIGGAYLLISQSWHTGKSATVNSESGQGVREDQPAEKKSQQGISDENTSGESDITLSDNKDKIFEKRDNVPENNLLNKEAYRTMIDNRLKNRKIALQSAGLKPVHGDIHKIDNRFPEQIIELVKKQDKDISGIEDLNNNAVQNPGDAGKISGAGKEPEWLKTDAEITGSKKDSTAEKETETSNVDPAQTKPPGKIRKSSSLFISLAAGPDLSAAGTKEIGKFRLAYGGLIGFTYREKITLRTGVFSVRKIYSATPEAYNPPPVFWTYYPNLKQVEADCSVIEIPVLVSYRFPASQKHSYSVTAGLSSYLMKRETYDYYYINASGQPANRKYTYRDINKHYFSVLTLAGGYQRKINNRFSFSLEPYIKVPLEGIGYGKVHLNSAGLLFTTDLNILKTAKKQ